ncbi:hypothetical protein PSTT_13465 [Puccinia striiformis]|uniref:Uncharacterized protein n=2 Tax=Puccinia striiformis TaxID=27350 RepID=A0A2S4URI9_9BASI|nr:hypothetical protein PSTT_13465 [Puccinia striiformis]
MSTQGESNPAETCPATLKVEFENHPLIPASINIGRRSTTANNLIKMKFSSLFACTIAALMINVPSHQVSAADTPAPPADGPASDTAEVKSVFTDLEKQGAGKTSASVKLPGGPAGAVDPQVARQSIINAFYGFLDEKVPEGTTGSVFQLLIQYLEKVSQGTGGAAGAAGAATPAAPDGAPAKAST